MTYEQMIIADSGCTSEDAAMVENLMRNEIFHSTLDWLTRAQLRKGARQAFAILEANREDYRDYYRKVRQAFMVATEAT